MAVSELVWKLKYFIHSSREGLKILEENATTVLPPEISTGYLSGPLLGPYLPYQQLPSAPYGIGSFRQFSVYLKEIDNSWQKSEHFIDELPIIQAQIPYHDKNVITVFPCLPRHNNYVTQLRRYPTYSINGDYLEADEMYEVYKPLEDIVNFFLQNPLLHHYGYFSTLRVDKLQYLRRLLKTTPIIMVEKHNGILALDAFHRFLVSIKTELAVRMERLHFIMLKELEIELMFYTHKVKTGGYLDPFHNFQPRDYPSFDSEKYMYEAKRRRKC